MERSIFSDISNLNASGLTFRGSGSAATLNELREPPPPKQDLHSLHYLHSTLFATVLEDVIMELRILGECNSILRIMKVHADFNTLIGQKYGIAHGPVTDELDHIDHNNLHKEEYKIHKIDNDRKFVTDIIVYIYRDLSENRSYSSLVEAVGTIDARYQHRTDLALDDTKNRSLRRELAKQLRQQRNHIRTVNYDTDVAIDNLRREMEDAILKAETRTRYVRNWQTARSEQHHQVIKDKEGPSAENIEYYKQQIDHEQRIHQEVDLLMNIVTNETLQKVEEWMAKYDTDMEAADLKIQIMKNRFQVQQDLRIELENTYAKHDDLMTNWITFKDERAKANAYIDTMTTSAIIVQAWWRGLLVRMELGPFKATKKKPPAKKKK